MRRYVVSSLFAIFTLLFGVQGYAQNEGGRTVDSLYRISKVLFGQQAYTEAIAAAETAIAIEKDRYPTSTDTLRRLYGNLGIYCSSGGDFQLGLAAVRSAYTIGKQLGIDTLDRRMIGYRINETAFLVQLLRYEEAIYGMNDLRRIIPLSHGNRNESHRDQTILRNLNNLGAAYVATGQYDRAEALFRDLAAQWIESEDRYGMGMNHYNLGDVHRLAGRYDQAIHHYQAALDYWANDKQADQLKIFLLGRLASTYTRMRSRDPARLSEAFRYADSVAVLMDSVEVAPQLRAQHLHNIALLYSNLGAYERALATCERVEGILRQEPLALDGIRGEIKRIMGKVYLETGRYALAEKYFRSALATWSDGTSLKDRRYVLWAYAGLADYYEDRADYPSVIGSVDSAFARFALDRELTQPGSRIIAHPRTVAGLTFLRAKAHLESARQTTSADERKTHLQAAIAQFEQLDNYVDYIAATRGFEAENESLGEVTKLWYAKALAACVAYAEQTQDQQWLDRAFYYSEKSKHLSVYSQWIERTAYGTETPWRRREKALLTQLELIGLELNNTVKDQSSQAELLKVKNTLEGRLYALRDSVRSARPDVWAVGDFDRSFSISRAQQILQPGECLLAYCTVQEENWLFVIRKDEHQVVRLPDSVSIYADSFYRAIVSAFDPHTGDPNLQKLAQTTQTYWQTGPWLYKALIEPAKARPEEHLILVTDGVLARLPFSALPTVEAPRSGLDRFDEYAYLGDLHLISHAYSTAIAEQMLRRKNTGRPEKGLLAVAPFYFGQRPEPEFRTVLGREQLSLPQLRRGRKEVDFLLAQGDGTALYYPEATKTELLRQLTDYTELYLSTHALAGEGEVFAALTRQDYYGPQDFLYGRELLHYYFPLELVMLNACTSGVGWLDPGEGMISLGRNFAYAGARSVLATRWPVRQRDSGVIMGNFYQRWRSGANKAQALRLAQQAFRQQANPLYSHPYYWAGPAIYGATNSFAGE